ncbi:RNA polymerase sigma factor [Arthrobacter bambusae]|uniref:DNA-directed RNA polymerase specialized sigma24 family protein n=1 Tax=Arthrobacter bambusae TaxID=1338426 RepID=A0AAW8DDN6_9MICC|nr:sigma factor-like helix-turn-helix DNA-binding protein [Arthrobacter bambusae]MDP9904618.1 DNA-directed RNA polymerase specialized sigma24 family protein [Arthrobacter bambusae]MDQ0129434.1 DNA-directed RNA polymerase specialized sigma24 family protein [Arthrobacter bambusae]MDQ0180953.1 DNA-directed RNA polymerase specialized sigma24 family protein [Arthrobacter bambusae]
MKVSGQGLVDRAPRDPEGEVANQHERLVSAMEALPELLRRVLWHAEAMGEPPSRIAALTGLAPQSVPALLVRARTSLREAHATMSEPVTWASMNSQDRASHEQGPAR